MAYSLGERNKFGVLSPGILHIGHVQWLLPDKTGKKINDLLCLVRFHRNSLEYCGLATLAGDYFLEEQSGKLKPLDPDFLILSYYINIMTQGCLYLNKCW